MLTLRLLMMLPTLPKAAQSSAILFLISGYRSPSFVTVLRSVLLDGFYSNCALFGVFIEHYLGLAKMHIKAGWFTLACVASVSVWFRSKKRPWKGILGFDRARNETRANHFSRGL